MYAERTKTYRFKENSMNTQSSKQEIETFNIFSIGYVRRKDGKTYLDILESYVPALKQLEHFSHMHVFWWLSEFQDEEYRRITQGQPPYDKTAPITGVFASRSPVRPNPIGLTTAKIIRIDHKNGRIEIAGIDAYENTPIVDLKAYFPSADRVKEVRVPEWIAHWPEWLPEEGLELQEEEKDMRSQASSQDTEDFQIFPVGSVRKRHGTTCLQIHESWISALKQIEHFSHIQLLWWFHRFDEKRFRRTTQCNPPYENAPRTGVFASRSPVRPNPIGLTTVKIVTIDLENGILEVSGLDAFDKTPIIDIKAYIPCCDRVKEFYMPEWVRHWPQWRSEEGEIEIVSPDNLRPGDSERLAVLAGSAGVSPANGFFGEKEKNAGETPALPGLPTSTLHPARPSIPPAASMAPGPTPIQNYPKSPAPVVQTTRLPSVRPDRPRQARNSDRR
jgi:tRNA-Thr(GGU) m(6)t(6)A37 methyltransferase TsaA